MSNATVNRIGFEIPAGYEIRDHIMWSTSTRRVGERFVQTWTAVSGTDDVRGITVHGYTITSRRDGRFALRATVRGKVCQYSVWGQRGEKVFDTPDMAKWFAAFHSEDVFAKSV